MINASPTDMGAYWSLAFHNDVKSGYEPVGIHLPCNKSVDLLFSLSTHIHRLCQCQSLAERT
jgi:hypothetical protein